MRLSSRRFFPFSLYCKQFTPIPLMLAACLTRLKLLIFFLNYRGADKSLARSGRKQTRKHVRDARDFNNIETRAAIKFLFFFLQGKAPKEIQAILTETLACFLPGRANDLSAPLYFPTLYTRLQYTLCLCSQCNTFRNFEIVPARRKQM